MIYLKTYKLFDLNKSTYLSAARKLSDIHHNDRSIELLKHSKSLINIKTKNYDEVHIYPTVLESINMDIPCEYVFSQYGRYYVPEYKTVLKFKDKSEELLEIDEYDIVQKWLDKKIDMYSSISSESFIVKYIFRFKILNNDHGSTKDSIDLEFDLLLGKDEVMFFNSEKSNYDKNFINSFSFCDRNSAKEFKNLFKMIILESETYIQRIIDNDYFKIKWDDIVNTFNNISLNKLYNREGVINFKFGNNQK